MTVSTLTLHDLQDRIVALEKRVSQLEEMAKPATGAALNNPYGWVIPPTCWSSVVVGVGGVGGAGGGSVYGVGYGGSSYGISGGGGGPGPVVELQPAPAGQARWVKGVVEPAQPNALSGGYKGKLYVIDSVDYWEKDAYLHYDGQRYYFQFEGLDCTLESALACLKSLGVEL